MIITLILNPMHSLQADWDAAAANDNTPDCDRPSLRSIVGGAGLIVVTLAAWTFFLTATTGVPA